MTDTSKEVKYYYSFSDTFLDTTYQIYLDCTYSADMFAAEVDRVKSLKYNGVKIIYDDENLIYPAYVARFGDDCTYEYVLIDSDNNRMVYIYLQFAYRDDIKFDQNLLPREYGEFGEADRGYSLY